MPIAAVLIVASACAGSPPEVPLGPDGTADPVLQLGRSIFDGSCKGCHGAKGDGGSGPRLNSGDLDEDFPELINLAEFISSGRKRMPAFGSRLSEEQITAVARYVREVL